MGTTGRTVVVVGGGYGGAAVAKALDEDTDVVLIDPKDAFVHAVGSLRALVRPDWASAIFFPYDKLLRRGRVIRDRAVTVDPGGVTLASGGRVAADYLVLATGSGYPYPAKADTDVAAEALARLRETHTELAGAQRVLIVGAGLVGLELAGEIKAVWPDKGVTLVDPARELVPGFDPALRADLLGQLAALGVELRLGTELAELPPSEPAKGKRFTVGTVVSGGGGGGDNAGSGGTGGAGGTESRAAESRATGGGAGEITADIWFRCYGVRVDSGYLGGALAAARTPQGQVRVTERLNVGTHPDVHPHVYALGDITDVAETKLAFYAMQHAEVVAQNILAQVRGEEPTASYRPSSVPVLLLPLGPTGGVGQVLLPDSALTPTVLSVAAVAQYKGEDMLTSRFAELFGTG